MNHPVQGLAADLCDLSAAQIAWTRAAAQRLAAAGFQTSISPKRSDDAAYFCGECIAFLPMRNPPLRAAPAEELMRTLTAHEDILTDIEKSLGVAAEFTDMRQPDEDWAVVTLSKGGEVLGQLAILTEICAPEPASAPIVMPCAFVSARLAICDAEALDAGDMVVLNHGPWPMVPGQNSASNQTLMLAQMPPLGFDPIAGRLVPILADGGAPAADPISRGVSGAMSRTDPLAEPSRDSSGSFAVPVAIHFSDIAVTQAELGRMAETGTFDLGAVSEGLKASLSIGGRMIGRGEIVRIGDRFAVLLDHSEAGLSPSAQTENAANGQAIDRSDIQLGQSHDETGPSGPEARPQFTGDQSVTNP